MLDMLTAKDMQELLQVDRSTIYRMAEAGQLPAVKVGKQWRFPGDLVADWLNAQAAPENRDSRRYVNITGQPIAPAPDGDLAAILPLDCVQLIQDAFAEVLGVTLVVTDLDGQPVTRASQPLPLYDLLTESQGGHALCQERLRELAQVPALEPRFVPVLAGLLCARALVRIGNSLKGMVVVFGVAPPDWPPSVEAVQGLARTLQIEPARLGPAMEAVYTLGPAEQKKVLVTIQRIADILAHIGSERTALLGRLANIAQLSTV